MCRINLATTLIYVQMFVILGYLILIDVTLILINIIQLVNENKKWPHISLDNL